MGLGDLVQNDYKCYSVLLDVIKGAYLYTPLMLLNDMH